MTTPSKFSGKRDPYTPVGKKDYGDFDIDDWIKEEIDRGIPAGPFCTRIQEPLPKFHRAQCERVFSGWNSSYIVLGRDRNSSWASGTGGEGHTQSGMIDIVVGRHSSTTNARINQGLSPITREESGEGVNPNFATDAARIYITQKAFNIDQYFGIDNKNEMTGKAYNQNFMSAVAMKADQIRIIGRDNVRIFAGKSHNVKGFPKNKETDSLARPLRKPKIELVCDNDTYLEPAVKGEALLRYLNRVEDQIGDINGILKDLTQSVLFLLGHVGWMSGGAHIAQEVKNSIENFIDTYIALLNSELRKLDALDGLQVLKGGNSILSDTVFIT